MKIFVYALTITLGLMAQQLSAQEELKNKIDSVSYSLGVMMGSNFKQQGLADLNVAVIAQAMQEAFEDKAQMDATTAQQMVNAYVQEQRQKMEAMAGAEGKAFLAKNGERPEVTTTASGLQYEVLVASEGPKPAATDEVSVHYHGTLINGTVFDSSVERGQPASFPLNRVIKGWTEGVQLMSVGSKYRFFIPSELAYGKQGAGAQIGPNSTLIFDVELLEIK